MCHETGLVHRNQVLGLVAESVALLAVPNASPELWDWYCTLFAAVRPSCPEGLWDGDVSSHFVDFGVRCRQGTDLQAFFILR